MTTGRTAGCDEAAAAEMPSLERGADHENMVGGYLLTGADDSVAGADVTASGADVAANAVVTCVFLTGTDDMEKVGEVEAGVLCIFGVGETCCSVTCPVAFVDAAAGAVGCVVGSGAG
jgi:hypothetical protein